MKPKKNAASVVLFISVLLLILFLTLQNAEKSAELSLNVQKLIQLICYKLGMNVDAYNYIISGWLCRKLAHTAEYLLLGITAGLLLKSSNRRFVYAVLLCAVISFLDQTVKLFVPGREFDFLDFPFDAVGYLLGASISLLFGRGKNNGKNT